MQAENRILICDYDPAWPDCFAALAGRVRGTLADLVLGVEHIGSTAVPGLAAKPIVDMDVIVSSCSVRAAISRLEDLGYLHQGDLGIAGREAFRCPPGETQHHLYLLAEDAIELRRHVMFREALRADPVLRQNYADLKRSLTAQYSSDRELYTRAKSVFITGVLGNDCKTAALL